MRTLIIATDFSEAALNAIHYAAALAQKAGAKLLIYHAYLYPVPTLDLPGLRKRFDEAYKKDQSKGENLVKLVQEQYRIDSLYVLDPMPIIEKLPMLMSEYQADLVIMGIRGSNPLNRVFFGSTVLSVLQSAKYPLLIVPEEATYKHPENILLVYNSIIPKKEPTRPLFEQFLKIFDLKFHLLKIVLPHQGGSEKGGDDQRNAYLQVLKDELHIKDCLRIEVEAKSYRKGVITGVQLSKADLLVVFPGATDFWSYFNKKSTTHKITSYIQVPLLSLP